MSSGNSGENSSCLELVLQKEVRLSLGLSGGVVYLVWEKSGVEVWSGLGVGVGLKSRGRNTVSRFQTTCTRQAQR